MCIVHWYLFVITFWLNADDQKITKAFSAVMISRSSRDDKTMTLQANLNEYILIFSYTLPLQFLR